MSAPQSPETAEQRLSGIRDIATALMVATDEVLVWQISHAINQLCMGTITVAQARAQLEF